MDGDWKRLGHEIRVSRRAMGLSQKALADRAGVSEGTIKNFERGRIPETMPPTLPDVGRALGKPEGWGLAIVQGRTSGSDLPGNVMQLPVQAEELPPDDDFVRDLRALNINEELRRELIKSYWRDKAREEAALREKYLGIAKAAEG